MTYGNAATGFVNENVELGPQADLQNNNSLQILKTQGAIAQSHLFKDRIVTALGIRRDQRFSKSGVTTGYLADGVTIDPESYILMHSSAIARRSSRTKSIQRSSSMCEASTRADDYRPLPLRLTAPLVRIGSSIPAVYPQRDVQPIS
jgi:hypothetical protein